MRLNQIQNKIMGKPSNSRLPVKSKSEESISKTSDQMAGFKNNAVNSKKQKNRMKKRNRKTNKQIKKLFESLRNESFTSQGPSDNITLDSTNNTTVIVLDDTIKSPNKRKLSETSFADKASKKIDRSAVVTDDVVIQSDSEPCHSAGKKIGEENSVVITDDDLQVNKKPCDFSNKKRTETAATDSVIITDEVLPTTAESNSGQQHNAINSTEPVIIKDDETLQFIPVPSSSKTPRKKHIAPPMNCSTPIARANSSIVSNNNADSTKNLNTDVNQTKVINRDSFLTIDLTTESDLSRQYNTVIDLENTQDSPDCSFVSISNASSMSGDSQVTVLRGPNKHSKSSDKQINKFVNGISKLDASDKGRLLELITKNIFNGCKIPEKLKRINISNTAESSNQAPEPAENTYIKEVILGQKQSRNSIGSNIYNPEKDDRNKSGLRMVVIDGSNVAMQHGMGRVFSVRGLKICIDYFLKRGHVVKAFVPRFRCKFGRSSEPSLLSALEKRGLVVFTPSREVRGKTITSYDDRYIVQCAAEFDGVIVSGDNYRDLLQENPRWRFVIENRLLQFTWVNDMIMFPRDPLGRNGPSLEEFLRHPVPKIAL